MSNWDVFHSDRLEVERGLTTAQVRDALGSGRVTEDDLVRPAGSSRRWERLGDSLDLLPPSQPPRDEEFTSSLTKASQPLTTDSPSEASVSADQDPAKSTENPDDPFSMLDWGKDESTRLNLGDTDKILLGEANFAVDLNDELDILEDDLPGRPDGQIPPPVGSAVAMPVTLEDVLLAEDEFDEIDEEEEFDPLQEDEAIAEFTLSRNAAETVEELDLAAMVDVAFQLVLFFLVTATTVLYKSLEVPKPNADAPADAAAQGRSKSLDELKADYILVEVDATGVWKIDRQPVPGSITMASLAEKLRVLRTDTGRTAMLFSADFATPHRIAVLAYDAANEIGLMIKIAKPTGSGTAAMVPPPIIKKI